MKKFSMKFINILVMAFTLFGGTANGQLKVGDQAPLFTLKDQDGKDFNMADVIGKQPVVVYFYPKDDTPGCTKEACSFRDAYNEFTDKGVKVIGISNGSVASHKAFAEKYHLPFTLLSDTDNEARKLYGVPKTMMLPGRVTYVIDKNGKIIHYFNSMTGATKHVEEALSALQ
ncbi:peroxiredoxin [Chitinophaga caeni]|nr:peroxiredoxin [Chitinophaga caeni]